MIIARSPMRITLGGGGTDVPSYYLRFGGFLIAAAIDKYVYLTLHETFKDELIIKYSQFEHAAKVEEIKHPIIREALTLLAPDTTRLEIASMADVPAGTGLGSSGSFTTALLRALHALKGRPISRKDLAELACHIEIDRLREPIGKQDQYIASFGGVTCLTFSPDGSVEASPLEISRETLYNLEDNLIMYFSGFSRSAGAILKDQVTRTELDDGSMLKNLHYVKDLGLKSKAALENGDLGKFADLMHEHWLHKKGRSPDMSNTQIDSWYELARSNGARGGKLIGAGGGGFLLFYTEEKRHLRHAMTGAGLREVQFRFDFDGTRLITQ